MLVTKKAPDFTAPAVLANGEIVNDFNLKNNLGANGAVLFFWPKDFTFVCPTEIIAMDNRFDAFKERGFNVIGISVDSDVVHVAWRNTPVDKGGIGSVKFPIVSDITKSISRDYDVLFEGAVSLRGTFIIDRNGIIKSQVVNDFPLGRNMDEAIRTVDALLHVEKYGEVCPAGWNKDKQAMKATAEGTSQYLSQNSKSL